jgi:hypothetical protein
LEFLIKHNAQLLEFFRSFQNEREDEQFNDEKAYLINVLEKLAKEDTPTENVENK